MTSMTSKLQSSGGFTSAQPAVSLPYLLETCGIRLTDCDPGHERSIGVMAIRNNQRTIEFFETVVKVGRMFIWLIFGLRFLYSSGCGGG